MAARAQDFVSKDELLLPILKAFAVCSRLLHATRSVWCFSYECVHFSVFANSRTV